jgi:hypothetical protein
MVINQLTSARSCTPAVEPAPRIARARRLLTIPGVFGIGYALSWIAGLSVPAPSPRFGAPGNEIVTALAGHGTNVVLQLALTEGLPAAGIAVISVSLARTARDRGAVRSSRIASISGIAAAAISLLQFVIGIALTATTAPATAHLLYQAVNRMDGIKMLALAVLAAAGASATSATSAASAVLPRWLRYTAAALTVAIAAAGIGYLLLQPSLALAAAPALVLLLVFMTGTSLVLGARAR